MLDLAPVIVWAGALTTLTNLAIIIWGIFSGPAKKASDALAAMAARVEQVERAQTRLRDDVDRLPSKDVLHELEMSMIRLEGSVTNIETKLQPVAAIADRLQELLLERGKL
jgi:hypothetical protein